ncbi:methyltransferase domain-containing protein [Candidatus Saccharibacteria bacterium]|nr:methyltransferase domain-containing protein [Candidatus Saccharibacteria bacterium]
MTREFPKLAVTGIELDPEIIRVAREFFDLDKIQNLTVVVGDGGEYIKSYLGEPFDLTFVDAYLGGNFPLHFEEGRFLRDLKRVTRAGGVVVINRASGLELGVFKRLLVKVFANVEVIKIPLPGFLGGMGGNYLFICS